MRWIGLLWSLGLATAGSSVAAAEPRRALPEGTIETDAGRVELLPRPIPVGRRVELPEGWYEVDEEGNEDGAVGSFTVLGVKDDRPAARESAPRSDARGGEELRPAGERPSPAYTATVAHLCRAQRSAFFRELWRESGVEVDDPVALLEGLDAGASGPATGYYWFALQADPFRNLAWSTELRDRARDLMRCVGEAPAGSR